jgi:hypothetical protein
MPKFIPLRLTINEQKKFLKQTALALTNANLKNTRLHPMIWCKDLIEEVLYITQIARASNPILPLEKVRSQELLKNHKILDKWRLLYRILSFSFS